MPTAAKLVGGLALALTGAIAAWIFVELNSDSYRIGWRFIGGNGVVGFFAGWYALGRDPGRGIFSAVFHGVRSLVFLLLGSAMLFSAIFILGNLERNNFRDPVDLPLLWIDTTFRYAWAALQQEVVIALLVGGAISGIVTWMADRRWP